MVPAAPDLSLNALLDQGIIVLTSSRQLAHALRLSHAQHSQDRGLRVWRTPQILPWNAWLRDRWLEERSAATHAAQPRLLSAAQSRVVWNQIVAASARGDELLNPASAARAAARSWQRMHDYLIPISRLSGYAAQEPQALLEWATEFSQRCTELHAVDEARLAHLAFDGQWLPAQPVVIAGFDVIPPAMQRLLSLWAGHGKWLAAAMAQSTAAEVTSVGAVDQESELQLAARWSRSRVEAGEMRVGIAVSDLQRQRRQLQRAFEDVFAPGIRTMQPETSAVPVTIAAPEPLHSYPIIDAALLCLQLTAGVVRSTAVGRILRSPFIKAGMAEQDLRALADHRLRDEQRDQWDWAELERWAAIHGCVQLQLAARELDRLLRKRPRRAAPSAWAEHFNLILGALGWPQERTLSSTEHQTVRKFHAALSEFGALDLVLQSMPVEAALASFQDLLRDTAFEPEALSAQVLVVDSTNVSGMHFDSLWVTGMDAGRWPRPANPDPLIALELQREAQMPEASAKGAFDLAQVQLQGLIHSAHTIVLSWAQRDGDAQRQRSPLLERWPDSPPAALPQSHVKELRRRLFESRPALERCRDDFAPALAAAAAQGGARILELQSRCAFRAQAELRLHARVLPRVVRGIEARDRGTLLHRMLADIWQELQSQQALLAMPQAALEQRVRTCAERHAIQTLRPTTRIRARLAALEIDNAVAQVMSLLSIELARAPFVVRFAEHGEPFAIGGLRITLQPDRIDQLASGGDLLIDYKLGDSHQPRQWLDTWPGRPRSPQLPLYAMANAQASALAFAVLAVGAVEFRGWSQVSEVAPGIAVYPPPRPRLQDPPDWNSLLAHWHEVLTQLAQNFVAGHAQVDPLPQECATCHLSSLCRIHEHAGAAAQWVGSSDE